MLANLVGETHKILPSLDRRFADQVKAQMAGGASGPREDQRVHSSIGRLPKAEAIARNKWFVLDGHRIHRHHSQRTGVLCVG